MTKLYAPSASATNAVIGAVPVTVDVFNDGTTVTFGVWKMTEAGPWEQVGAAWQLPSDGPGQITVPGNDPETDTVQNLLKKYGKTLLQAFCPAICSILAAAFPVQADPPANDPPADPPAQTTDEAVAALQAFLPGSAIVQAPSAPPTFTMG